MRLEKLAQLVQLARQLVISADGMTLDDMAAFLGASRRTADRTRALIEDLFPQLEAVQDGQKLRFHLPKGLDGFLNLPTADELAELENSINTLQHQGANSRADLLLSLSSKIQASLRHGERLRLAPDINALVIAEGDAMQAGPRPMADSATLSAIRMALKSGNMLRFSYASEKSKKSRLISPWGLLYGKAYYLVGPSVGTGKPVLWRLDRLKNLRQESTMGTLPPEGWSLQDFASQSFGVWQNKQYDVALRFSPSAAIDARRFLFHPTQQLTEEEDGSLHVTFTASGLREMAYHLFTWGKDVTILAPTELRDLLIEMCNDVVAHYQDAE